MILSLIKSGLQYFGLAVMRSANYFRLQRAESIAYVAERATLDLLTMLVDIEFGGEQTPFLVQVGANDGLKSDPLVQLITERQWRGVLIEPQPEAFARLQNRYAKSGLVFENVAIGSRSGTLELFRMRPKDGDRSRHDDLTTCSRDRLDRAKAMFRIDGVIETLRVPMMTLPAVLTKHQCSQVDVLIIDTEGMDFEIIASLDLCQYAPAIIQFEYVHLRQADVTKCLELLSGHGYRFAVSHRDIVAYRSRRRAITERNSAVECCTSEDVQICDLNLS